MTRYLTITFIFLFGLGCSTTKGQYTYEVCVQKPSETSEIVKNENIGIADTIVAFLSGQIIGKGTNEPLAFANVILTNQSTGKKFGMATDTNGTYTITAPADEYEFQINYVGYSTFKNELKLGTGEIREIDVALGQGGAFVTYEIKSYKKLSRRQLNKKAEELKKEK
ncbi:MAG: carboxypeptidase-like regulatory domain-containing protein [Cytophagales bacterium]|nr:carboxypeptidase-like regulatory domain-containing protein [Cytophagales bacterium]